MAWSPQTCRKGTESEMPSATHLMITIQCMTRRISQWSTLAVMQVKPFFTRVLQFWRQIEIHCLSTWTLYKSAWIIYYIRMHSHRGKTIRRKFSEYFEYWHAHLLWQLENTILFKLGCTKAIIYLAEDGSDYSCGNGTVCSKVCDSVVSVPCIGRCNRSKQLDIEDISRYYLLLFLLIVRLVLERIWECSRPGGWR